MAAWRARTASLLEISAKLAIFFPIPSFCRFDQGVHNRSLHAGQPGAAVRLVCDL
jgi:hypothetical protein